MFQARFVPFPILLMNLSIIFFSIAISFGIFGVSSSTCLKFKFVCQPLSSLIQLGTGLKLSSFGQIMSQISCLSHFSPPLVEEWKPPNNGVTKLKFDGSSLANLDPARFDGVFRNSSSAILASYIGPLGVADSITVELQALHHGLLVCKDRIQEEVTAWQQSGTQGNISLLSLPLCERLGVVHVFSCAYLVNLVRPREHQIPMKHQKALWYSGLRGAMAFALALQSVHDLPEGHGKTMLTATTAIVIVTSFDDNNGYTAPPYDEGSSLGNKLKMRLKEFKKYLCFKLDFGNSPY